MMPRFFNVLALSIGVAFQAAAADPATFQLKAVRSTQTYGPYAFRSGVTLRLESGIFRLDPHPDGRTFRLIDTAAGTVYGQYELVTGRIIDIGDVLFTLINVKGSPSAPPPPPPAPSILDNTTFGVELSLLNHVAYLWEINGLAGAPERRVERTSAALHARKGLVTLRAGMIPAVEWTHTVEGDGETFENATLTDGSGWFAAVGIGVPVFTDGRWSATLHGEVFYRRETLALRYGAWEIESITSITDTNDSAGGVVSTTTRLRYNRYDKTAVLAETLVSVDARLSYEAPAWFLYAGLRALPWVDTTLGALVTTDDKRYRISFTRKDPVMGYGGAGFTVQGVKCWLEVEGGGETAVRLGLAKGF